MCCHRAQAVHRCSDRGAVDAVFVSEMWIAGDQSAPRGLSNVPWVRRGRGSQREARAAAWEAVCEK